MTRILRDNDGLITVGQLRQLAFTARELRGLMAHGDLRQLHRGVYVDGRCPVSDHAHLKAALLAFPDKCNVWLSGHAAAAGWGLDALSLPRLEVTVVGSSTPNNRPGLIVRSARRSPALSEVRSKRGLRLSSVPRLLIESAARGVTPDALHVLIEQAVRRGLLDVRDLATTLERHRGDRGTAAVKRVCEEYLPHTDRKSGLERAFDRWLLSHPEIPAPERNVRIGPWEIDCHWPDRQLALELDGRAYHTVVAEIERDRRKDAWLQAHGLRILRVTGSRFERDRPGVYRDLTALMAAGAGATQRAERDALISRGGPIARRAG